MRWLRETNPLLLINLNNAVWNEWQNSVIAVTAAQQITNNVEGTISCYSKIERTEVQTDGE